MKVHSAPAFRALAVVGALVVLTAMARGAASSGGRQAPEFPRRDPDGWLNSGPLTMAGLRGRVVLLDVWTFG
jgi:hypothetical protein